MCLTDSVKHKILLGGAEVSWGPAVSSVITPRLLLPHLTLHVSPVSTVHGRKDGSTLGISGAQFPDHLSSGGARDLPFSS